VKKVIDSLVRFTQQGLSFIGRQWRTEQIWKFYRLQHCRIADAFRIRVRMVGNLSYLSQVLATGTDRRLVGERVDKTER
jgi:hypothetical protein